MRFLGKHGKIILRVFGSIGTLVSIYLLVGGVICFLSSSTMRDGEGYYPIWDIQINKDSYAIVLTPDGTDVDGGWDMIDFKFKIECSNNNPSNQIFVGVAEEADINAYLSGVNYDEIKTLRILPSRASYQNHSGSIVNEGPTTQTFWVESAYGTGTQNLIWQPEPDRHSLVLMNEDGSAGMDMHLVVGTGVALLFIAGSGNLIIGVFVLLLSLILIFFSGRTPNVVYPEPLGLLLEKKKKPKPVLNR